jgi:hypothetical protein
MIYVIKSQRVPFCASAAGSKLVDHPWVRFPTVKVLFSSPVDFSLAGDFPGDIVVFSVVGVLTPDQPELLLYDWRTSSAVVVGGRLVVE